jgi:hypothetical protein
MLGGDCCMKEKFLNYIENMKTESIKEFSRFILNYVPEYFWTSLASPSGKWHGGDTLVQHVLGCLFMGTNVCEQFEAVWTQEEKDCLMAALMFHDAWKSGDGKGIRYTEKDFKKDYCLESSIGMLKSNKDHPEIAYNQIYSLASDYNKTSPVKISSPNLWLFATAIRFHMGPWTNLPKEEWNLLYTLPYQSVIVQAHNIDYHQSKNKDFKND